jgi:hypothetical protein
MNRFVAFVEKLELEFRSRMEFPRVIDVNPFEGDVILTVQWPDGYQLKWKFDEVSLFDRHCDYIVNVLLEKRRAHESSRKMG